MDALIRHTVTRNRLVRTVLRWLGFPLHSVSVTDWGVKLHGCVVEGTTPVELSFADLSGPPSVLPGLLHSSIVIPTGSGAIRLAGFNRSEATEFLTALNAAASMHAFRVEGAKKLAAAASEIRGIREDHVRRWAAELGSAAARLRDARFAAEFSAIETEVADLAGRIRRLRKVERYPSASLVQPLWLESGRLMKHLAKSLPDSGCSAGISRSLTLTADQRCALETVVSFHDDPEGVRAPAIDAFLAAQTASFDGGPASRLTGEQRRAVATDEDATLVLAGAGSGKTSVIVEKAAYLIERGIRHPHEILLVTFGTAAAREIAKRVAERVNAEVEVRTFHALGYAIINEVEHPAPTPAPHVGDERRYTALLRSILLADVASNPVLARKLMRWFAEFHHPHRNEWDFDSMEEYRRYVDARELRTLQGERVRGFEELEIANWLYMNGIPYRYEPVYRPRVTSRGAGGAPKGPQERRAPYRPDFHLEGTDIFVEHFGLRIEGHADGRPVYTTAPGVNLRRYLRDMEWKRRVHRDNGTTLVETFSYEKVEGRLTAGLESKLGRHGIVPEPLPYSKVFEKLAALDEIDRFTPVVGTFLKHFKSSGVSIGRCRERAAQSSQPNRAVAFLDIFGPLFLVYQKRLKDAGQVDFEDMIARATDHAASGRYTSPYRQLIVDEFQDIFRGSAELLKALKKQNSDADADADTRLFAVGDDWQSIYRFLGADVGLVEGFGGEFGGDLAGRTDVHARVDLTRTFRSVDAVALPAREFILRNPAQLAKDVKPAGTATWPAIHVRLHRRGEETNALDAVLAVLNTSVANGKDGGPPGGAAGVNGDGDTVRHKATVLLLGRYNALKPDPMPEFGNIDIAFMSCHRAKGLEADHVVILGANAGGFPSEVVDDSLLDLVLPDREGFDHAEERRLFYVALTRARLSVTILADRLRPSSFLGEFAEPR